MDFIGSLLEVRIDFDESHRFFPTIVCAVLALLLLAILVTRRREVAAAFARASFPPTGVDGGRLLGTLAIVVAYFAAMRPVGDRFPNTGLGFLICSVPFLFALGTLYLHERSPRRLLGVLLCSLIAPAAVWYLFYWVLAISLP